MKMKSGLGSTRFPGRIASNFLIALVQLAFAAHASLAATGSLSVSVTDSTGATLENVAVYAEPVSGEHLQKPAHSAEIAQMNRQFIPLVTVVQVGTEISFPNNDSVKHHVYSFSPAKTFDQPLYSGKVAPPQLFDKAGTVVLGCNIHDKMIAYVQVVNTPYFGKTDGNGKVKLDGLPAGKYVLKAWYYNLPPLEQVVSQPVTVTETDSTASFKLNTVKKPPEKESSNYNSY
jgi:plastocyanin